MARFVLVHSPLVGPTTWSWVAAELRDRGHDVQVPSASGHISSWRDWVEAIVADIEGGEDVVLAGHSGAGPLLPVIASRMAPPPSHLVFVDAGIPPREGHARLMPQRFLEDLAPLARDGVLPRWSEWFGAETMAALVPDPGRRDAVVAELPGIPLSYFEETVPMPAGWTATPSAYLLLSEAYRDDVTEAKARGWPAAELPGSHLDIVTRAAEVAEEIIGLTR